VSSQKQLAKESKDSEKEKSMRDSLVTQGENAVTWVQDHKSEGFVLDDTLYLEDRAVSAAMGKNIEEGQLRVFLDSCKDGTVPRGSFLLFDTWSRGSRGDFLQQCDLLRELLNYDITIVTVYNLQRYGPEILEVAQSHKIWILVGEMMAANAFSNNLREKGKDAWTRRRRDTIEKGDLLGGICPAWLTVVDGKYVLVKDRVAIVRRIYAEYMKGLGSSKISIGLVQDDIPTFTGRGNWSSARVATILKDKSVLGYHTFKAKRLENNRVPTPVKLDGTEGFEEHKIYVTDEEVITSADWLRVQELRLLRGAKRSPKFKFSVLEKLLECGYYTYSDGKKNHSKIRLITRGSNAKYSCFQSDAYLQKYKGAVNQYWRQDCLEAAFLNSLPITSLKIDSDMSDVKIKELQKQIADIDILYDNRSRLLSQTRDNMDILDMSLESKQYNNEKIKELEILIVKLANEKDMLKKELEDAQSTLGGENEIAALKDSYINNMGNGDIISSLNLKLRSKIKYVTVYALGLKYNPNALIKLASIANDIAKKYNIRDTYNPLDLRLVDRYAAKHFEYCPPSLFGMIKGVVLAHTWNFKDYKATPAGRDTRDNTIGLEAEDVFNNAYLEYPAEPSEDKHNRFFIIRLKSNMEFWVKPRDINIERNSLVPVCKGIDWIFNGFFLFAPEMIHDKLLYDGKKPHLACAAVKASRDSQTAECFRFTPDWIRFQEKEISPNLGQSNKTI
tara:strand:+ start:5448 stop:7637 length:2190 start_codon:yes stop_codon:yes gene_type:complete